MLISLYRFEHFEHFEHIPSKKKTFKLYDWLKSYHNSKWWITNGWILSCYGPPYVALQLKNPAYGRNQLSWPVRILGPIQFWRGCVIYRSAPKSGQTDKHTNKHTLQLLDQLGQRAELVKIKLIMTYGPCIRQSSWKGSVINRATLSISCPNTKKNAKKYFI